MMKKLLILVLLLACTIKLIEAQNTGTHFIKGTIQDPSGNPIISASISIPASSQSILSDLNGKFVMGIPDTCTSLVVNAPGFISQSLSKVCSDGKELKIQMAIDPTFPTIEEEEIIFEDIAMEEPISEIRVGKADRAPNRLFGRRKMKMARQENSAIIAPRSMPATYNAKPYPGIPDAGAPPFNTEDYDLIQENRFLEVKNEPLSTFSIDVDAASYSNMRRFIQNGSLPPKDAVRIEEMVNYFNYEYPKPESKHPFKVITELSDCPWNPDHQLLHIGLQGKKIPTENLPASNLVFLLDVSGSMDSPNKLPLLKSSFRLLTNQLRVQDRVSIVVYAGSSGVVLKPTTGDKKMTIINAFNKLKAGGSTAGGAGIQLAYKLAREHFVEGGNNRVILATDGDFNVGTSSDAALVRLIEKERESGVFLTILGFGMGNYKDNKMQKLAQHGNGNHAYIDNIEEARKVLVGEFGGTMFTIAKDVKLQLEFNPAYVEGYRLIGYENRLLNNEDFNDDKKDAGELGSGHTVTALYEIIPKGVKSDFLEKVDDLKYQDKKSPTVKGARNNELMTVKLRYKQPDGDTSTKLEHIQSAKSVSLNRSSNNFRWSAAIAEFGLLLRDSEFKGKANYEQVVELAKGARGADEEGYRSEFLKMARTLKDMVEPITADRN